METLKNKRLQDLTVEDLEKLAQQHAEPYGRMFKKVARHAFMEGILWAQKTLKEQRGC